MTKYVLKSKIRPLPDINKIIKEKTSKIPSIDYSKYVLKSKINTCPPPVDLSKYVLKTSVPPPCKKCMDKPCEAETHIRRVKRVPIKPKICCPPKPKIIIEPEPLEKSSPNCCSCEIISKEEIEENENENEMEEENLTSSINSEKCNCNPKIVNGEEAESFMYEENEINNVYSEIQETSEMVLPEESPSQTVDEKITSEINNTISTYAKNSILTASTVGCAPYFDNSQQSKEPMGIISGSLFK